MQQIPIAQKYDTWARKMFVDDRRLPVSEHECIVSLAEEFY